MVTWILDVDSTKQRVNKYTVQNQNISIKFFWIYFENFSLSAGFKNLKKPNNHICLLFFLFLFCNAVLVGVVAGFDCTRMINLSNLLLHVPWETFLWRFLSRDRKEIKDFADQRSKLHRNPWFNHTQNSFFLQKSASNYENLQFLTVVTPLTTFSIPLGLRKCFMKSEILPFHEITATCDDHIRRPNAASTSSIAGYYAETDSNHRIFTYHYSIIKFSWFFSSCGRITAAAGSVYSQK